MSHGHVDLWEIPGLNRIIPRLLKMAADPKATGRSLHVGTGPNSLMVSLSKY